jgi:hypothetical protein
MGCIVREKFPGLVMMPDGRTSVAWTWKHYSYPLLIPLPNDDDDDDFEDGKRPAAGASSVLGKFL